MFKDALYDFVSLSVRAVPGHGGWLGSGAMIRAIEHFLLPAILLVIVATSVRLFLREKSSQRYLLPSLALIGFLGAVAASHIFLHMNYPEDRLTLPLFVLLALAWAIAVSRIPNRAFRMVNGLIAVVLIVQFMYQFHVSYFTVWQFDAGIRPVARRLRDELRGKPARSVSVSATWYSSPALEFYRDIYNIGALNPVERNDPAKLDGYDYYVLNGDDRGRKTALSGPPVFYDELSGVELFK